MAETTADFSGQTLQEKFDAVLLEMNDIKRRNNVINASLQSANNQQKVSLQRALLSLQHRMSVLVYSITQYSAVHATTDPTATQNVCESAEQSKTTIIPTATQSTVNSTVVKSGATFATAKESKRSDILSSTRSIYSTLVKSAAVNKLMQRHDNNTTNETFVPEANETKLSFVSSSHPKTWSNPMQQYHACIAASFRAKMMPHTKEKPPDTLQQCVLHAILM